jgi:glycosyltransferase involved in cell wall biosynthesis
MSRPPSVVHVITGLDTGGAEMMLYRLLGARRPDAGPVEVLSLTTAGPVAEQIRALGVTVRAAGLRKEAPSPLAIGRLGLWLGAARADVVQTWMPHADLLGGVLARVTGARVAWGVHRGNYDELASRTSRAVDAACARLSRFVPARIVCCSETTRAVLTASGFAADKLLVIQNGFDLSQFKPDAGASASVRRELGLDEETPLVGMVTRFHVNKDLPTFFAAAARLAGSRPDARFVLCGSAIDGENAELARMIDDAGVRDRVHLLGRREDVPRVTAALDVACSSSYTEAFPLVIGEAMACGVPCAVTDAGDSALMVGDTGRVAPVRDPDALASACAALLALSAAERRALGAAARRRIEARWSLGEVAARYDALHAELARR